MTNADTTAWSGNVQAVLWSESVQAMWSGEQPSSGSTRQSADNTMEERLNLGSDVTDLSATRGRRRRPRTRTGLKVEFENEGGFGPSWPADGAERRSSRMSGFGERISKKLGFVRTRSADSESADSESAQATAVQRQQMLQALPRLGQRAQSVDDLQTQVRMQRFRSRKEKDARPGVVDRDTGKFYLCYSI